MNFQQIVEQLKQCKIRRGVWIDAGCGIGTFTFPLATLASQIIALDRNMSNLSYLESKISTETNIITRQFDFTKPFWHEQFVDGVLFGFSLHYDAIHKIGLEHAYNQLKQGGKVIIIEYSSDKSVPWVPYPLLLKKLISILIDLSFKEVHVIQTFPPRRKSIQWDNASYMVTALK